MKYVSVKREDLNIILNRNKIFPTQKAFIMKPLTPKL